MDIFRLRGDILASIDKEIAAISDKVSNGKCHDMSEYGRDCGVIQGFKKAKDLVRNLFNATAEDGDPPE